MRRQYGILMAGLCAAVLASAAASAERATVAQPMSKPGDGVFADAIRAFSGGTTVELPGSGTVRLSARVIIGFQQDPVRRLELQDGTTLYWGWQHRQAFVRSVAVTGPDGQVRLVAAARDLPRILNLRSGRAIASPGEYDAYLQGRVDNDKAPSLVVVAQDQNALHAHYPLVRRWVQASALGFNADCSDPAQARSCAFAEAIEVPATALAVGCGSGHANDCPLSLPEGTATDVPLEAFRQ